MGFRIEKNCQNAENQMEVFPEKSHSLLCDTKLSEILRPNVKKEDEVNRSPKNYGTYKF